MNPNSVGIDLRVSRERIDHARSFADRITRDPDDYGVSVLGQTSTDGNYPDSAQAVYKIITGQVNANDTEGSGISFVADTNGFLYAAGIGSEIPAEGTLVIVHSVGGKWCFEYNG